MDRPSGQGQLEADERSVGDELVSRSCELGDVSFGASLDTARGTRLQWATPDGLEILGCGEAVRFSATGRSRFRDVRTQATATFATLDHDGPSAARPRAFGGFSFHDGHEPDDPWGGFGAATFVVPSMLLTRSDDGTWLTTVDEDAAAALDSLERWRDRLTAGPTMRPSGRGPGVVSTRRTTTREQWIDGVETALRDIEDGRLEKVVLAQALEVTLEDEIDVPAVLERLRRGYPNCYRFLLKYDGTSVSSSIDSIDSIGSTDSNGTNGTFFGAPPERLVSKSGVDVTTEALAGSVPRGDSPETDDELAAGMIDSEKVQREHGLVVDAIRAQLEPLSHSVTVDEQRIRQLATIQHLWTPITARLDDETRHILDIVEALHPTPAVGGVPPEAAWETMRKVESFDRGWYAAPIGWFDATGDGEFAVGIRSGVATGETATLFAGNGIVDDSDPADEWDEALLKYRPILDELRKR